MRSMENKINALPEFLQSNCVRIDKFPFLWRSYKSFKNKVNELCDEQNRNRINKSKMIEQYVKHLFYGLSIILIASAIGFMIKSASAKYAHPRYDRRRYRKVVKEGILWDSVEWHER